MLPTPVFWPGEFHGWYSPGGHKESDMTDFHIHVYITCLLRNLYTGQEATIGTGHGTREWFKIVTMISLLSICLQRYCIIIDYFPHTVHFIAMTHFVTESLYLLISLTYFSIPPPLSPLVAT